MFQSLYRLNRFQRFLIWLVIAILAIAADLYFNGVHQNWSLWTLL